MKYKTTVEELLKRLEEGWKNKDDIEKLYLMIQNADLTKEELNILRDNDYADMISGAYSDLKYWRSTHPSG